MNVRLKGVAGWVVAIASLAVMVAGLWPGSEVIDPDVRAHRLETRIACPWCDGQSLAESGAEVASDLSDVLRQKVDDGWTDDEIYAFFAARYGEQILLDPPWLGRGLALWALPVVALIAGTAMVLGKRVKHADVA